MIQKITIVACILLMATTAEATRVKDIANLSGVRKNQLTGYGLVVGLNGTGDSQQSQFTTQSIVAMMSRMGMRLDAATLRTKNVAAVMVTADLPPFSMPGARIDVVVSSMGDAKSLTGGTLLITPLKGVDGKVYSMSQGPLTVGGYSAGGAGSSVSKNHPTVGRIPSGATVEVPVGIALKDTKRLTYILRDSDFTTAQNVALAISAVGVKASAVDGRRVIVEIPEKDQANPVPLIARIEIAQVSVDVSAKVVLNARTGTVVMGANVQVGTVALAHGALHVEIIAANDVSQPNQFGQGQTVGVQNAEVKATEVRGAVRIVRGEGATLDQLVAALNLLGVSPRDLIDILQAMKSAGALNAEIEVQ